MDTNGFILTTLHKTSTITTQKGQNIYKVRGLQQENG
jgi:hypothetical protein